jgi:hypothetical protein
MKTKTVESDFNRKVREFMSKPLSDLEGKIFIEFFKRANTSNGQARLSIIGLSKILGMKEQREHIALVVDGLEAKGVFKTLEPGTPGRAALRQILPDCVAAL